MRSHRGFFRPWRERPERRSGFRPDRPDACSLGSYDCHSLRCSSSVTGSSNSHRIAFHCSRLGTYSSGPVMRSSHLDPTDAASRVPSCMTSAQSAPCATLLHELGRRQPRAGTSPLDRGVRVPFWRCGPRCCPTTRKTRGSSGVSVLQASLAPSGSSSCHRRRGSTARNSGRTLQVQLAYRSSLRSTRQSGPRQQSSFLDLLSRNLFQCVSTRTWAHIAPISRSSESRSTRISRGPIRTPWTVPLATYRRTVRVDTCSSSAACSIEISLRASLFIQ